MIEAPLAGPVVTAPPALHRAIAPALVSDAPAVENYLHQITRRLVNAAGEVARDRSGPLASVRVPPGLLSPDALTFHLAASPVPGVYSTGSPHVYLYNGLLQRTSAEDELAAAMAHELAHLILGDTAPRAAAVTSAEPVAASVLRLSGMNYPLETEVRADDVALMICARAGWDPSRYLAMLGLAGAPADARLSAARSRLDRLPPVSGEWARPPIADERWFARFKRDADAASAGFRDRDALRLLAALPSPFLVNSPEQIAALADLERQLAEPPPAISTPAVVAPTEAPSPFEKGPRNR